MKKQILILTLLLLQFGFSQEDLKMSSKLSECAALESDLARLACYDELAKKSVSVNNEKSETTNEMDVGSWRVGEDVNPIDDTKTFTAIFLPLSLVYVYYAKIKLKTKILLVISYTLMFGVVITVWYLDSSIYGGLIRFDIVQALLGFTKLSYQLRFDLLLLTALFPLTIALMIKAKKGISIATPILFLIAGSLVAGPIVEIFSDFYVLGQ